jgi:hypothetical protein
VPTSRSAIGTLRSALGRPRENAIPACGVATTAGHTHQNRYTLLCEVSAELDVKTLVWTRGEAFPLDQLASRLKCPRCGNRRVLVFFELPNNLKSRTV